MTPKGAWGKGLLAAALVASVVGRFSFPVLGIDAGTGQVDSRVRQAAERGDARSQVALGSAYALGKGVPKDAAEAMKWFRKAAEQGDATAELLYGIGIQEGNGAPRNPQEALGWYRRSAEHGHPAAMVNLGLTLYRGLGVEADHTEAVRWFRAAADKGDRMGEYWMGVCYLHGRGVANDDAEGMRWILRSAAHGHAGAQLTAGAAYATGRGVSKNHETARTWVKQAAQQEDPVAQFLLGLLYSEGEGVQLDREEGVRWFRRAAEKGDARAMNRLGVAYAKGEGVLRNPSEAVRWWLQAADKGSASACHHLATAYENGEGVSRDEDTARKWRQRGSAATPLTSGAPILDLPKEWLDRMTKDLEFPSSMDAERTRPGQQLVGSPGASLTGGAAASPSASLDRRRAFAEEFRRTFGYLPEDAPPPDPRLADRSPRTPRRNSLTEPGPRQDQTAPVPGKIATVDRPAAATPGNPEGRFQVVRVGGPEFLHKPHPGHPDGMPDLPERATVELLVTVDAHGVLEKVEVGTGSGTPQLDHHARDFVHRQWIARSTGARAYYSLTLIFGDRSRTTPSPTRGSKAALPDAPAASSGSRASPVH